MAISDNYHNKFVLRCSVNHHFSFLRRCGDLFSKTYTHIHTYALAPDITPKLHNGKRKWKVTCFSLLLWRSTASLFPNSHYWRWFSVFPREPSHPSWQDELPSSQTCTHTHTHSWIPILPKTHTERRKGTNLARVRCFEDLNGLVFDSDDGLLNFSRHSLLASKFSRQISHLHTG